MTTHTNAPDSVQSGTLTELQMSFDRAIGQGRPFHEVKIIYQKLKALKRYLKSVNIE